MASRNLYAATKAVQYCTLKAEMKRRGLTYGQLVAKLAEIGVRIDAHVLRNKVACGGFSAVFFVRCLRLMGVGNVWLDA